MAVEIRVPPLGSISAVAVSRWLRQEGDYVVKDEILVELETEKVTVEVAAQQAGTLGMIARKEGDTVGENELLGSIIPGVLEGGLGDAEPPRRFAQPPGLFGKLIGKMIAVISGEDWK
jgi:2-oxoglutarate dehydrogenase E2 component (dihydrolipoamide succinyltransferase)